MSEVLYISKCLRLIEQKLNRGSSKDWGAQDYKIIQKLIFDASSIYLSTQTLERLFGRLKKNYNPQGDTKNALAVFLGYQDWENFKSQTAISVHEYEDFLNSYWMTRMMLKMSIERRIKVMKRQQNRHFKNATQKRERGISLFAA